MARIHQSITPSKGLKLVNDMIHGTDIQKDMVNWKKIHTSNTTGTVGVKYWRNVMRHHGDKIRSQRGAKYSLIVLTGQHMQTSKICTITTTKRWKLLESQSGMKNQRGCIGMEISATRRMLLVVK